MLSLGEVTAGLKAIPRWSRHGRVVAARGSLIEVAGLAGAARIGSRVVIARDPEPVEAEVTGLDQGIAHCLPFNDPHGIATGARADLAAEQWTIRPSDAWLGRTIDALGRPLDGHGALRSGARARPMRTAPPPAAQRGRLGHKLDTGVAAIDVFAPLCRGQRMGLFAGSGVGKSMLLSMLARWTECDVAVIGLIGERGREVQEFVEDTLGPEGRARSVVVVATSDESALMRRQAAWTTLAVAEHFRDCGRHVLCLMDSVTRFAMAQREIGLASGEPPATRGYTPTVFAELPRLLERAGPGLARQEDAGAITGIFTVLVDGDDHNEPIADAVRGILDGHLVLGRKIAERGRFPAVDVLKSVSRMLPRAHASHEKAARLAALRELSAFGDMEEMIRLGAYQAGASAEVDRAIALVPGIEALLHQDRGVRSDPARCFEMLAGMLSLPAAQEIPDADAL